MFFYAQLLATVTTVMARSATWVATATIGLVSLVVLTFATYTLIGVMLSLRVTMVQTTYLLVTLRKIILLCSFKKKYKFKKKS